MFKGTECVFSKIAHMIKTLNGMLELGLKQYVRIYEIAVKSWKLKSTEWLSDGQKCTFPVSVCCIGTFLVYLILLKHQRTNLKNKTD